MYIEETYTNQQSYYYNILVAENNVPKVDPLPGHEFASAHLGSIRTRYSYVHINLLFNVYLCA